MTDPWAQFKDAPEPVAASPPVEDAFSRNRQFAKPAPAGGYLTKLAPVDEAKFRGWIKQNNVPFDPSPNADYDMRGFYQAAMVGDPKASTAINRNDGKMHFGDTWKTPYHKSFSAESKFANDQAPKWNSQDQLVLADGSVVFDERKPADSQSKDEWAQFADADTAQPQAPPNPTEGMSTFDKFAAGSGKAVADLGRGVKQLNDQFDARNFPQPVRAAIKQQGQADAAESRQLDAPLLATTAGKVGNIAGSIATTVPTLAIPGANTVAGAGVIGATLGALQPEAQDGERLKNAAMGGVVAAVSQGIGGKVASWAQSKLASRATNAATSQSQNAVRDATLQQAQKAGYVVPPSTTNPTATNRVLESVSGKAATHQAAALKNQAVTNRLVREELGLPKGAPLTKTTLNGIRAQEGNVYKAVKASGKIATDSDYVDDLIKLSDSVDTIAKDFPDLNIGANKEIHQLTDGLLRDSFDSSSAVELVKQLRKDASSNLSFAAAADPAKRALGTAQREAAGAVEDMLVRHLNATGKGALASKFDAARIRIAKSYSVEAALNDSTGNVVATQLGTQLKKGKPLSGNFETIAKFAQAFPEAARELKSSAGVSALDAMTAVAGGSMVNPALFALPAARIGVRSALLSKAGQAATTAPKYAPGRTTNALLQTTRAGKRVALPVVAVTNAMQQQ